jgi:hypothetical protein
LAAHGFPSSVGRNGFSNGIMMSLGSLKRPFSKW